MKFSVVCMSLLLAFGNIGADEVPKNEQRKEDYLQTYILEPSNDLEDESTTIIPPLVEGEPSPVIISEVVSSVPSEIQESPTKIPNESSTNQQLLPQYPPYYPYHFPYPYDVQWPQYAQQPMPQPNTPNYPVPPNVPTTYVPMQTEYQGILVPIQSIIPPPPPPPPQDQKQPQHQPPKTQTTILTKENQSKNQPGRNNFDLAVILQALLPPTVLQMIVAWANFILNSFTMMAFAGAITSTICSLTPICTLTFSALPLSVRQKITAKMTNEDGSDVTTIQRVRRAADMVSNALDKYEKLQKGVATIKRTLDKSKRL